ETQLPSLAASFAAKVDTVAEMLLTELNASTISQNITTVEQDPFKNDSISFCAVLESLEDDVAVSFESIERLGLVDVPIVRDTASVDDEHDFEVVYSVECEDVPFFECDDDEDGWERV
ncbi:hypothetical protein HDU98_005634, partial [Podochytrium sp. JEL0797]